MRMRFSSGGLVAPQHGIFSPDQGSRPCPCSGRQTVYHWTIRGSPILGSWVIIIFSGSKRCSQKIAPLHWNNHQLAKTNKINFIGIPKSNHKLASTRGLKERADYFRQEQCGIITTCIPSTRMVAVAVWVAANISGAACLCQGANTDLVLQLDLTPCACLPGAALIVQCRGQSLCLSTPMHWEGIMTVGRIKDTDWPWPSGQGTVDGESGRQIQHHGREGRGWRLMWEQGLERKESAVWVSSTDASSRKIPGRPQACTLGGSVWAACKQEVEIMTELWVAQFGLEMVTQTGRGSSHILALLIHWF